MTVDRDALIRGIVKPDAEAQFADWFRKNYPGPGTIIHKPDWHSARIFRAAQAAALDMDALVELVGALKFYALEQNYEGFSATDPCGCCSSWYEPKIHATEDNGTIARAALARIGVKP